MSICILVPFTLRPFSIDQTPTIMNKILPITLLPYFSRQHNNYIKFYMLFSLLVCSELILCIAFAATTTFQLTNSTAFDSKIQIKHENSTWRDRSLLKLHVNHFKCWILELLKIKVIKILKYNEDLGLIILRQYKAAINLSQYLVARPRYYQRLTASISLNE